MRRVLVLAAVAAIAFPAPVAAAVSVAVDRTTITRAIGHTFSFRSTITNHGSAPAASLVAHLNVVSLHGGTYVDPEDWSSHRTRYLAPIPGGGSTTIEWRMQAVNSGDFGVYVAVLPQSGAPQPPATSPTVRVEVAKRRTLDSGGILPLALGMPLALGLLKLGLRLSRRQADGPGA